MSHRGIGMLLALWFSLCALKGAAFYGLNWLAVAGTGLPLIPWQAWTAGMVGYSIFRLELQVPAWVQAEFEDET
jgi:hypothetical protein